MKIHKKLILFFTTCFFLAITACNQDKESPAVPDLGQLVYRIEGPKILKNNIAVTYKGVNAMQTFGLIDPEPMREWKIQMVREFIGNLREQPIAGAPVLGSDQVWYHSLQNIVDQNRTNQMITVLCPFGWVNESGERTLLTGLHPASQPFYGIYKLKMREIAEHFKDQEDVWIQLWNEPYHWNNENGYSHELWLENMKDMVDNLRGVSGFHNIILVPGNEQGQSENAILEKGNALLRGRYNLLFDVHAYEKWLLNTGKTMLESRLSKIQESGFALIIGEVGVLNVADVMPVQHFLDAAQATQTSVLGWLWNRNSQYPNALLDDEGQPHANAENNFWGNRFKDFLGR